MLISINYDNCMFLLIYGCESSWILINFQRMGIFSKWKMLILWIWLNCFLPRKFFEAFAYMSVDECYMHKHIMLNVSLTDENGEELCDLSALLGPAEVKKVIID